MSDAINVDFGPLVIIFQPGKLSDLAAVSFAAALLRYKITCMRQNGGEADIDTLDLAQVSIPTRLKKIIDDLVYDMNESWTNWWSYHKEDVFLGWSSPDFFTCLDQISWLSDGTINSERTAGKMLIGDVLTKVQKFQFACAYCLMDDVERLKGELTQAEVEYAVGTYREFEDEFHNYWRCKTKLPRQSTLEDLLDAGFGNSVVHHNGWSYINNYYFDLLSNEDCLVEAFFVVELYDKNPRFVLNVLTKLTSNNLNLLLRRSDYAFLVMQILLRRRDYFENTILVWKRMIHVISNAHLARIIRYVNDLDDDRSYVNCLLTEMWHCILDRQKQYIADNKICDFIEKSSKYQHDFGHFNSPNFPLILDLLSRSKPARRYEYWLTHWRYLVIGQLYHKRTINGIMKLCIVDDQKIEAFKKTTMIKRNCIAICKKLIKNGRIKEIQPYLEFCTSDLQQICDLKKTIIMKMLKEDIIKCLLKSSTDQMMDFHQYLGEIFTENESKQFLNEIITSPGSLNEMFYALMSSAKLNNVFEIAEKFASSEESLVEVKRDLFKLSNYYGILEKSVFRDLRSWCEGP